MKIRLEPMTETIMRPVPDRIEIPPHGFVQYLDHLGTDQTIVEAARTSTGKGFISWEPYWRCERAHCGQVRTDGQLLSESCSAGAVSNDGGKSYAAVAHAWKHYPRGDAGILEYMYRNRHETPAEMPVIRTLWKAPIKTFRQLHRHRAASYNEQSARYGQLPGDFYVCRPEGVKGQGKTNKQGSEGALPQETVDWYIENLTDEQKRAYEKYETAIAKGIALETARDFLPNTVYSVCMIQMNLRMDLHLLGLRDDPHAEGITQEYARAQAAFTQALFPRWYALYEEYTKYGVRLSRTEAEEIKALLRGDAFKPREGDPGDGCTAPLSEGLLGKFK